MGRKVRNADWHLWALHTLNPYEKHDSGFFTTPYCLLFAKPASLLTLATQEAIYSKASNVV